jgi:outer membrane protein TolC
MRKGIFLSLLVSLNLFALDISEAIDSALKNNFTLKEQEYIKDESKLNLDSSTALYRPKIDLNYSYSSRDNVIVWQNKKESNLSLSLSYNLFNGFRDKYAIESAKYIYEYNRLVLKSFREDLKLEVKRKYIDYLLKQKREKTLQDALKLYERQHNDSKNFYNQGLIAKNEFLEVEVEMLQATSNLESAKKELKIAKLELENIIGIYIYDEVKKVNFEEIELSNIDLENRSELKALEYLISSYKSSKKVKESLFMPKADASLSINRYGDSLAPNGISGYPNSQSVATLSLSWNLYKGNSDKIDILKEQNRVDEVLMRYKDLKQKLELQYNNAIEELALSKLNLATAKKALDLAKLNYEIVNNKVREGISSNKDLIDANYLLTKSKENYFDAYYSKYLAISTLQRVVEID